MRLIDSDKLHYSEFKCANGKTVRAINERDIQGARAVVEHGKWIRHRGRNEQCSVEEVAKLFYSNSCVFCPKKCMGVDSVKKCVSAIREKYEVDYWKEVEK